MSLPIPTIAYQDGTGASVAKLDVGAEGTVTPGNQLTLSLQGTSQFLGATMVIRSPGTPLDNLSSPPLGGNSPWKWTFPLPAWPVKFVVHTSATGADGNGLAQASNAFVSEAPKPVATKSAGPVSE